jgi:hypothetical protein
MIAKLSRITWAEPNCSIPTVDRTSYSSRQHRSLFCKGKSELSD